MNDNSSLATLSYYIVFTDIIDFSCDFESDMCNWSVLPRKARFKWTHGHRSGTKIPAVDHTSACEFYDTFKTITFFIP